jgi:hypothetical protein
LKVAVAVAAELRVLSADAQSIWTERAARRAALDAIVTAWERGSSDLGWRVDRVDQAVTAGLNALGLPRGPVRTVEVQRVGRGWAGRKFADSRLLFDGDVMRQVVRVQGEADDFFRTWVHESLHARQAFSREALAEVRPHQGYEEGMVEALARLVTREKGGMRPLELSYAYYVAAYQALPAAAGIDAERWLRSLWQNRTGEVRASFVDVLDGSRWRTVGERLTETQRRRVRAIADQVFSTARINYPPTVDELESLWRIALA